MAKQVGYDLKKYLDNVDNIVKNMEKGKGSRFKYAKVKHAKTIVFTISEY